MTRTSTILRRNAINAMVAVGLAASTLLVPMVARADEAESGSKGVAVTVEIVPRACEPSCGGGGLPVTGLEASGAVLWIALALIAFGLVLLRRRRVRAMDRSLRE